MFVESLYLMQLNAADFPGTRVGIRQDHVMNGLLWGGHCVRRLLISLLEFGLGEKCHVMNLPIVVALLLSPTRDFLAVVLDQKLRQEAGAGVSLRVGRGMSQAQEVPH